VIPLQAIVLLLVGVLGTAVVAARDELRQLLVVGVFGLALVLLFVVLQAPDVALSELVVSTIALPFVLLVAIARVRTPRVREHPPADEGAE
jgi:energy-converting hydrogenase B subunit D